MDSVSLLYLNEILSYLNSVVIKFVPFENMFNNLPAYLSIPGFNANDKTTFPYYRILAGDTAFATVPIHGYSPDLQTEVLLTPAVVASNPDIVTFYQDLDNLNVLLARYPNDQFLVRRVLNPVTDIAGAIAANNLTLLTTNYQDQYLNEYEQTDIEIFLQQQLRNIDYRWYMSTFEYEDLYPTTFWGMLWPVLTYLILTRRVMNIKTINVHPYHIWEYLTSLGFGSYKGYLSRNQELYLYRNAQYLKWNAGKEFLLNILENVFLTPIGYSLSAKTIIDSTYQRQATHDKFPNVVPQDGTIEEFMSSTNFASFLTDIYNSGYDIRNDAAYVDQVTNQFVLAPTNKLETKFLEFNRNVDETELVLLLKFILDSTMYLNSENMLKFGVTVPSPITEAPIVFDNVIDALNLMYYCVYADQFNAATLPSLMAASTFTKYTITTAITHTSAPTIPANVLVNGLPYYIISYVDLSSVVANCPYISKDMFTVATLSTNLGAQYAWLFEMIQKRENISEEVSDAALTSVLRILMPEMTVINVNQTYTTFTEFFAKYTVALTEINKITTNSQYDDFIYNILTSICPLQYGFAQLQRDDEIVSTLIEKIKELFEYLISYNIALINKTYDETQVIELPKLTAQITGDDGLYENIINSLMVFSDFDNNMDYTLSVSNVYDGLIDVDFSSDAECNTTISYSLIHFEDDVEYETPIMMVNNDTLFITDSGTYIEIENAI